MNTENLSTLKIHKLTQAQYDRELAAGRIDANALYLTPDEANDSIDYATQQELDDLETLVGTLPEGTSATSVVDYINIKTAGVSTDAALEELQNQLDGKAELSHNHDSTYDAIGSAEIALATAKEYTNTKTSGLTSTTTVETLISTHNTDTSSHNDIRALIADLSNKLNAFLDVDDATTDQLSEVLTLIENNKGTLESLTSSKVNVSDIVNNLTTNSTSKVLSAAQGVVIKGLIDALDAEIDTKANTSHIHTIADITNLQSTLDGKAAQTSLDSHTSDTTKHITSTERTNWNAAYTHSTSAHAPSNAEKNQNAFSNITVGSTTVSADKATDTVTFVGSNVTITPDTTNGQITFKVADGSTSAKGIVQLTNSTSSTSTTTAATPNSVKEAYDFASEANTIANAAFKDVSLEDDMLEFSSNDGSGVSIPLPYIKTYTDNKVAQEETGEDAEYPLLSSNMTASYATTRTTTANFSSGVTLNPFNNSITATTFNGNATSANTATKLGSSTVGSDLQPIYLNSGIATKVTTVGTAYGGTGATTVTEARTNLDVYSKSEVDNNIVIAFADKMSSTDPVGTGSFSMNRLSGSTVGMFSHTAGYDTTASGDVSYAEGDRTVASATGAHAEGYLTTASGLYSHAEGYVTTASGVYSHAEGNDTTALDYQHAQGHFNKTSTATAGVQSGTSSGAAFVIGNGTSSAAANAFRVTYAGKVYGSSTYNSSGADYAEFFEWQDSNPNAEDRRGYFVTLDGEKIKIAEPNDYILGIVSGLPAIIGNSDEDWRGRYILDDFGAFITEEFEYEEEVYDKETGQRKTITKIGTKYKENPDYDPTLPYIQREDRPEWDAVGMIGVLNVRDDGTCEVNGYCKVSEGGIATASESGYRVIKRVNDNIVKVIFR